MDSEVKNERVFSPWRGKADVSSQAKPSQALLPGSTSVLKIAVLAGVVVLLTNAAAFGAPPAGTLAETCAPVNAVCGAANGVVRVNAPNSSDLCTAGTPTVVNGAGPWDWGCIGLDGGKNANCATQGAHP